MKKNYFNIKIQYFKVWFYFFSIENKMLKFFLTEVTYNKLLYKDK